MSRLRQQDIAVELIELSEEVMDEIRQQLIYYRASVYKDETAQNVKTRVEQLRLMAAIVADEAIQDAIRDYDAMAMNGAMQVAPGECSFSTRVTKLLSTVSQLFDQLRRDVAHRDSRATGVSALAKSVQTHRKELLAMCRHGSRQWAFFQSV